VKLVVMGAALLGSSCKPGIQSFNVDPPCVCRGGQISVRWAVAHGDPLITVDHPPADWPGNQPFKSCETRNYHVQQSADFVITVPGANAANADGRRQQSVTVVDDHAPASASTPTCVDTAPIRAVSGKMPTVSSCGAPVARIHDPVVQGIIGDQISNSPRRVCLVDPSGVRTCVEPGATGTPLNKVVDGKWTIEIPLLDAEHCDGPVPGLATLQIDLDCDKVAHAKE